MQTERLKNMYVRITANLWGTEALHHSNKGEEVAIFGALEEVSHFDVASEQFGPLQGISCCHHRQGDCLGQVQVSVGAEERVEK